MPWFWSWSGWQERRKRARERKRDLKWKETFQSAYRKYLGLVASQDDLMKGQGLLRETLARVFNGCPRLRNIQYLASKLFTNLACPERYEEAKSDLTWDMGSLATGCTVLTDLLLAAHDANHKIEVLSVIDISHYFFTQGDATSRMIGNTLSNLQRLTLSIGSRYFDEDEDEAEEKRAQAQDALEAQAFTKILRSCVDLRELEILLPFNFDDEEEAAQLGLRQIFGSLVLPELSPLRLQHLAGTEDETVNLILRHRTTLQAFSIDEANLTEGSWTSTFDRVAGRCPLLQDVSLHGAFHSEFANGVEYYLDSDENDFAPSGWEESLEEVMLKRFTLRMQEYIKYGGTLPNADDDTDEP